MNTLCKLQWTGLTTDTNGDIKPCCISRTYIKKDDGTNFNLGTDTVEEIYNSKSMVDMRQQMLDGVLVAGCEECYESEKFSGRSNRLTYNQIYKDIKAEDTNTDPAVKFIDLRFGNLCNLSCRSCNPKASSQFQREIEVMPSAIKKYQSFFQEDINSWYQTPVFKDNLEKQLDSVDMISLTGGEPTIIQQNMELLASLVSSGRSKNIVLAINSNMTNTNPKFYNLIKEFKYVVFMASIDGVGSMQEYLRYPSKWETMDANIKKLLDLGDNISVAPTPVIQTTNLNKCVELFEYFESYNREAKRRLIRIQPINLTGPEHLNLLYLPSEFKMKCWEKIQQWVDTKCEYQPDSFHEIINGIKAKCNTQVDEAESKHQLSNYKEFNSLFDSHRKVKLSDINPELDMEINKILA